MHARRDSNAVGSGVTQEQVLSEQLSRAAGQPVYGYAPGGLGKYFLENLAQAGIRPKVVVLELIERDIVDLSLNRKTFATRSGTAAASNSASWRVPQMSG